MADRPINNDDLITIIRPQGGNKPEYRTIKELNNKFSTEEQSELTTLQAQVGNYDPASTLSTITADLATLQGEVETATTGLLDRMTAAEGNITDLEAKQATAGAPIVSLEAATAVLTAAGVISNGNTVTVNDVIYTFKTALTTNPATVPNEILIGANKEASMGNLKLAINGEATEGTNYSMETEQPTDVTATVEGAVVTCTATTGGEIGNAYPKDKVGANLDWDGTGPYFTGGVNITAGVSGAIRYEASKLWISVGDSTAAVSNWKYAELT